MRKGEVYYADLSPVVGSEQGGVRPVVIIQNDAGNQHSPTTIIAPMTTRSKSRLPTHVAVTRNGVRNIIMLEQTRVISRNRLISSSGALSEEDMAKVDQAILVSFGLASAKGGDGR
ncbi:type II toxin-antitoxin system PemK/MazF family toxin [uncultured Flavonifractor sp.]|uniref:type II toxin-antitoxin system PemK/MazF family toxin n=1 Tax=uncultured Flavonifractor sp. TaxID=1193534 RepID=UPI00259A4006|nr:type II toxin-antitoxin system PemK/MazF family toxin [uncultured Flavonifractor sp.]